MALNVDHMFTNSNCKHWNKISYNKADISDLFPILFVAEVNVDVNIKTEHILICDKIKIFDSVNHSNNSFLQFFLLLYNNVLLG